MCISSCWSPTRLHGQSAKTEVVAVVQKASGSYIGSCGKAGVVLTKSVLQTFCGTLSSRFPASSRKSTEPDWRDTAP